MSTFVVRPSNSEKEAFRIKLTAVSLLSLKLKSGDLCTIRAESIINGDYHGHEPPHPLRYAIAWENSGTGMKDNIVQTSRFLQELHGLKLGDKVVIERAAEVLQDADVVRLSPKTGASLTDRRKKFWEEFAELTVRSSHECLATGQSLSFRVGAEVQEFEVSDTGTGRSGIGRVTEQTTFSIPDSVQAETEGVRFTSMRLGGLQTQIEAVQKLVDRLLRPRISSKYAPRQGLLLYGAKGVGKTFFTDELAASGWKSVVRWQSGAKTPAMNSSTLVIVDQIDLPSTASGTTSTIRELDRLFKAAKGKPCLIVTEARHPNDVHQHLRSKGNFSFELEIPIPSAVQRHQILKAMRSDDDVPSDEVIDIMAEQTHGYVAGDLFDLLRTTLELASERPAPDAPSEAAAVLNNGTEVEYAATVLNTIPESTHLTPESTYHTPTSAFTVESADVTLALTQVRPSALQEIFLETPSTRWTDIGGQHHSKRLLINAVERPLKSAERMARLNLRPKKGVLLYGPPGCSKTLLVRALAREAGLNFLAVKGAELISMYVGESERATREVFRKARAASPSIIFFDEIDSIASRSTSSSGNKSSSSSDLNVLTTLLNEMDGFETLSGVFVVAATNKPEAIDPALLRPGRFDNIVYIPPPDLEARKEIFATQFRRCNYTPTPRGQEDDVWYFAEKTAGFSGAEVVGICQAAAELALDAERDEVRFQDVEEAVRGMPRSIGKEMLEEFERWGERRMMGV